MVRRQTRVQKRNRRQKTKRNNRRQNKTLRRKRQSRRKGGSNNYKKLEAKLLGISIDKYIDLEKEVKKIKTVDHLMAYKLGMDVGKYRDIIKTQANFTGLPVDEINKVYEEAISEANEEHVILEKMDSIIAKKLGFENDIKNYKKYCQNALINGSSVIQLIREYPISQN